MIKGVLLAMTMLMVVSATSQVEKYQLTEIQTLRLQVKQRDAQIAQQNVFFAQQQLRGAMEALNGEAVAARTDNKWPENLVFDTEKIRFVDPPPVPKKDGEKQ